MANLPYVTGNEDKILGVMKMFSRMGAYPLDPSSVFNSIDELNTYINEAGSYAYAGQIVAVANGNIDSTNGAKNYTLYVIRSDKSIQEIGKNLIFDSVDDATAYSAANPAAFRAGEVFTVKNNNRYDMYTFSSTGAVQKLSFDASTDLPSITWSSIENKPTTIKDYGITDAVSTNDVVTTATPDKILKLNGDAKLPASITGEAGSVEWANVNNKPDVLTKLSADTTNANHISYDGHTVANLSDIANIITVSDTEPTDQAANGLWFEVVSATTV